MKLQTFQGKTMAEALAKVKRELGRNAVILNTRTRSESGWLGLRARNCVEITASNEPEVLRTAARRATLATRSGRNVNSDKQAEGSAMSVGIAPKSSDRTAADLGEEMRRVRSLVENLLVESRRPKDAASLPAHLQDHYVRLIQQEVSQQLALELLEQLRNELTGQQLLDRALVRRRLAAQIAQLVPAAGPCESAGAGGAPRVIALIGPTGVGKTTTIAKLAANFKLRENKKVALVTIDTYRIAAVDQLRTYAQIIDVPLSVVLTPDELRGALDRHRDADVILIDTAGRSQNDTIRLNELKRFLVAAKPHETHLVLSSTSTRTHLLKAAEGFARLGVNRVLLTKLDEAVGFGVVLSVMHQLTCSLSYLTTGQDVPDDIELYDGRRLASLVIGEPDPEEREASTVARGGAARFTAGMFGPASCGREVRR